MELTAIKAKGWSVLKARAPYFVEKDFEFTSVEEEILLEACEKYKQDSDHSNEQNSEKLLEIIRRCCRERKVLLDKKSGDKIVEYLKHEFLGFGPLDFVLNDCELEEISVIGINKPIIVYRRKSGWVETNLVFESQKNAINTINKMARTLGRRITTQNPRLNASLPNGDRIHASIPPISKDVEITIRKFSANPLTICDIISSKTISCKAAAFLWTAMFSDSSILVAGNTGSGKTSTLNALFSFIPSSERIIIVEETPEIQIPHAHQLRLIASEDSGIEMKDLISDTLRMRPDRQIVGEVRKKEEAQALFECIMAGQAKGTYATLHAQSATDALNRITSMGIGSEVLNSIDLIIIQRRIPKMNLEDGKPPKTFELRRVTQICEIENGKAMPIFSLNYEKDELEMVNEDPAILKRLEKNYVLSKKESLKKIISQREEFLSKLCKQKHPLTELTNILQNGKNT